MEMISESRAASNTCHRLQYDNSRPRRIKLVGLGMRGGAIANALREEQLNQVEVVIPGASAAASGNNMLGAIAANAGELAQSLNGADVIVVVASAADDVSLAPVVRQIARQNKAMVSGVLIGEQVASSQQSPQGLHTLRASSDILVVVSDDSYVMDMLDALRA
jgi:cell division GTPase FtsZ